MEKPRFRIRNFQNPAFKKWIAFEAINVEAIDFGREHCKYLYESDHVVVFLKKL